VSSIEWPRDGTNWASYKGIEGAKIFWCPPTAINNLWLIKRLFLVLKTLKKQNKE